MLQREFGLEHVFDGGVHVDRWIVAERQLVQPRDDHQAIGVMVPQHLELRVELEHEAVDSTHVEVVFNEHEADEGVGRELLREAGRRGAHDLDLKAVNLRDGLTAGQLTHEDACDRRSVCIDSDRKRRHN